MAGTTKGKKERLRYEKWKSRVQFVKRMKEKQEWFVLCFALPAMPHQQLTIGKPNTYPAFKTFQAPASFFSVSSGDQIHRSVARRCMTACWTHFELDKANELASITPSEPPRLQEPCVARLSPILHPSISDTTISYASSTVPACPPALLLAWVYSALPKRLADMIPATFVCFRRTDPEHLGAATGYQIFGPRVPARLVVY